MRAPFRTGAALAVASACLVLSPIAPAALDARAFVVAQKNRMFAPSELVVPAGSSIRFTNEDPFLHQMFTSSAAFSFASNEQAPGETVDVAFPTEGDFKVMCGIHPKMSLSVRVR